MGGKQAWIVRWLVTLLLVTSAAWCSAETFTATARVVAGNVQAARDEALRSILWEAGLQGESEVRSRGMLVNDQYLESTAVTGRTGLKSLKVVSEEVRGEQLKLVVDLERQPNAQPLCEGGVTMPMVRIDWNPGNSESELGRQAGRLLGTQIRQALREDARGYLWSKDSGLVRPSYVLAGQMDEVSGLETLWTTQRRIRFRLMGANGQAIREHVFVSATIGDVVSKEGEDLGYATLRKWGLTRAGWALVTDIRQKLVQELRCLPVVLPVPEPEPDGSFTLTSEVAPMIRDRNTLFIATAWPVDRFGVLDMTLVGGLVRPDLVAPNQLRLRLPKKPGIAPRQQAAGSYVVIE